MNLYSQEQSVLKHKYAPVQLKEDVQLIKNVILSMHPVVGIYEPKERYAFLFDSLSATIKDSMTEKDFRIRLKILFNEMHCGHTEVLSSKEYIRALDKQRPGVSPYVFFPVNNKLYMLTGLNRKKDTLIKKGDEILRINGVSADSMMRLCRQLITTDGHNITGKDHYMSLAFNSFYPALFGSPDTFKVEYRSKEGFRSIRYAKIRLRSLPPVPIGPKDDSLFTVYRRASIKYKFMDEQKRTAFVRVHAFSRKRFKRAYRKIFRSMHENNTQHLILDLRNNGGGSLENSYRLLSYLMNEPHPQTLSTTIKNYPYRKYTNGNVIFRMMKFGFGLIAKKSRAGDTLKYTYTIKPRKKHHFNGKIYVLMNGGSFSASCLVAAYLKHEGKTIFIGEETAGAIEGCNAGITPYYKLPNTKMRLRVPAFRVHHDVIKQKTAHGIYPDYPVQYGIKEVMQRKDLELIKALELIN